ncbi:hypothetical protein ACFUGD_01990 [Streptomyces sp. NPDC057217]|uniref:hypothetical protein n=1 Tax=Streptomyces sp. NPDC057217 TaxID=3346054 RepID=UPI00363FB7A3
MRRLSRRELARLYANALEQRDQARTDLAASRSVCRAQATELDQLRTAPAPAAGDATELARAKRTIAHLDEQLRVLEASNLELSRAAMERAGTAVKAEAAL